MSVLRRNATAEGQLADIGYAEQYRNYDDCPSSIPDDEGPEDLRPGV